MRFSIAVLGLLSGQKFAVAMKPEQVPEDTELRRILKDNAAAVIGRLPEIYSVPESKYVEDYSKILGFFGYNPGVCDSLQSINHIPICRMPNNFVGDPAPDLNYGIHIRRWKDTYCAEIVAKILDDSGSVFLISVKLLQSAMVSQGRLYSNHCHPTRKARYVTVKDEVRKSMAQYILASPSEGRLNAWIRFLVNVASSANRASFLNYEALRFLQLFQSGMVAVTVFKPVVTSSDGFKDGSGGTYVKGTAGV
jgi:hypothetical protein